jgi:hypothetical protein
MERIIFYRVHTTRHWMLHQSDESTLQLHLHFSKIILILSSNLRLDFHMVNYLPLLPYKHTFYIAYAFIVSFTRATRIVHLTLHYLIYLIILGKEYPTWMIIKWFWNPSDRSPAVNVPDVTEYGNTVLRGCKLHLCPKCLKYLGACNKAHARVWH